MTRIHDLGGMPGFGPVPGPDDDANFHHAWEAQVFALTRTLIHNGVFNWDEFRHSVERMPPAEYLTASYYEKWLAAIERLCREKGLLDDAAR